jgi:hypothetical protein
VPSDCLDIAISSDQVRLLNPTIRDVQVGSIIEQCTGQSAKKVIAKRRIDIVTGNINSYARVLNGPHQLEKIKTYNELAATMAVLKEERTKMQDEQREKKRRRTRRRQNEGRRKRGMQLPRQRNLNLNAELMWRRALIMY